MTKLVQGGATISTNARKTPTIYSRDNANQARVKESARAPVQTPFMQFTVSERSRGLCISLTGLQLSQACK